SNLLILASQFKFNIINKNINDKVLINNINNVKNIYDNIFIKSINDITFWKSNHSLYFKYLNLFHTRAPCVYIFLFYFLFLLLNIPLDMLIEFLFNKLNIIKEKIDKMDLE